MMTANVKCAEEFTNNHCAKIIRFENVECTNCDKCTGCSNLIFSEDPVTTRKTAICTKMNATISRNINSIAEMYSIRKPIWCTDNISKSDVPQDVSLALFLARAAKM